LYVHYRILYKLFKKSILKAAKIIDVIKKLPYFATVTSASGVKISKSNTNNIIQLLALINKKYERIDSKGLTMDILYVPIRPIPDAYYTILEDFINIVH
jgi:hypothetical protein